MKYMYTYFEHGYISVSSHPHTHTEPHTSIYLFLTLEENGPKFYHNLFMSIDDETMDVLSYSLIFVFFYVIFF